MKLNALYAGSFDPITNGHLNIIERASVMFDSLTVSVVYNPSKKSLFTVEERMECIKEATAHLDNIKVDSFIGLLADYVNGKGFDAVVRGLRATTDFVSELQMAQMNARLYTGDTETIFLMTDPKFSYISSSLVKEVASFGGDINGLLPDGAYNRLIEKFK